MLYFPYSLVRPCSTPVKNFKMTIVMKSFRLDVQIFFYSQNHNCYEKNNSNNKKLNTIVTMTEPLILKCNDLLVKKKTHLPVLNTYLKIKNKIFM